MSRSGRPQKYTVNARPRCSRHPGVRLRRDALAPVTGCLMCDSVPDARVRFYPGDASQMIARLVTDHRAGAHVHAYISPDCPGCYERMQEEHEVDHHDPYDHPDCGVCFGSIQSDAADVRALRVLARNS